MFSSYNAMKFLYLFKCGVMIGDQRDNCQKQRLKQLECVSNANALLMCSFQPLTDISSL